MILSAGITGSQSASRAVDAPVCTPITDKLQVKKLGKLYAFAQDITDPNAVQTLIDVRSSSQTPSASVMKTVTAAAALKFIGTTDSYRATTTVLRDPAHPGTIILRGGGDVTLTRLSGEMNPLNNLLHKSTYFFNSQTPAKLMDLASEVESSYGNVEPITKIILDDSFFAGKAWNPNWASYHLGAGNASPITGLMVDAARVNPDQSDPKYKGARVKDPTMQTGTLFKQWLVAQSVNASGAVLVKGKTPSGAEEITNVQSTTMTNWIKHALLISDNAETEVIARHTILAMGLKNDYRSVQAMGRRLFTSLGLSSRAAKKLIMKDASGLSQGNRVTPKLIATLMKAAANPDSEVSPLKALMETSNQGTLAGRLRGIPQGSLRAKTGFISGLYSLSGIITTPENHTIVFAIFARQDSAHGLKVGVGTKAAIDGVVQKLYTCGASY